MPRPEQSLHPFDSVHRPDLRASDAEREQVVETLRSHGAEGRLGPEELAERLDEAYASSTLGQLQRALRELPERPPSVRPERSRLRPAALRVLPLLVLTVTIASFGVAGLGFLWPLLFAAPWALGVARGGSPRAGFGPCGHKHRRRERAAAV
ncbi:MAG: DUF1707 SHOCT-like domain-containing protein [Thermoleophilaceae bacterium]